VGDTEGRAMIVTFSTCADSIRTVPFLQHDPDRPEDVMTDSEDHARMHVAALRPNDREAETGIS
jgi:hypothetical protein